MCSGVGRATLATKACGLPYTEHQQQEVKAPQGRSQHSRGRERHQQTISQETTKQRKEFPWDKAWRNLEDTLEGSQWRRGSHREMGGAGR